MSNENAKKDVLNDIDRTIEGLKDAKEYGMFAQHEEACEKAISRAVQLLNAMREVLKDE